MSLYPLFLLLGLTSEPSGVGADAASCPTVTPDRAAYVQQFFSSELSRPFRERHKLLAIQPGDVRALTDPQDAAACQRMARALTLTQAGPYPKVWRGYQAGAFYIMQVSREVPAGVYYHSGGVGLVVFDANMRIVAIAS